jgi:bacteriocin biosynthesis cyclodehydratase domain-containing protein
VKPRLRAGLFVVRRAPETAVFSPRPESFEVLDDPDGIWRDLLALCDGTHTAEELPHLLAREGHAAAAGAVAEGVSELVGHGLVVDAELDVDDRFANQRAYLEQLGLAGVDVRDLHDAVRDTHVLVLGAGGVGSWLSHALAMAGVRALTVVDADRVEERNLCRQPYPVERLGERKIVALGSLLARLRPDLAYRGVDLHVDDHEDLASLLDGIDVVAACADQPSTELVGQRVSRACLPRRVPHVVASYSGPVARIGPTWVPRRRPPACLGCLALVRVRTRNRYEPTTEELRAPPGAPAAVTVAQAQIVAAMACAEILHLRAGLIPATVGRVFALDLRTLRSYRNRIPRQRDCPTCGVPTGDAREPVPPTAEEVNT